MAELAKPYPATPSPPAAVEVQRMRVHPHPVQQGPRPLMPHRYTAHSEAVDRTAGASRKPLSGSTPERSAPAKPSPCAPASVISTPPGTPSATSQIRRRRPRRRTILEAGVLESGAADHHLRLARPLRRHLIGKVFVTGQPTPVAAFRVFRDSPRKVTLRRRPGGSGRPQSGSRRGPGGTRSTKSSFVRVRSGRRCGRGTGPSTGGGRSRR